MEKRHSSITSALIKSINRKQHLHIEMERQPQEK